MIMNALEAGRCGMAADPRLALCGRSVWALALVLEHDRAGGTYNIGTRNEMANLKVVRVLYDLLDELFFGSPCNPQYPLRS